MKLTQCQIREIEDRRASIAEHLGQIEDILNPTRDPALVPGWISLICSGLANSHGEGYDA